ncbi:MAG: transketolase [Rhodospirillaceae bacterium]
MTAQVQGLAPVSHSRLAGAIRILAADAIEKAKSGHPGMPLGMADVATVLFTRFLKYDAAAPRWADRDRFVLSAGHGSMLLYALGYLTGFPDLDLDQIRNFRQFGSNTPGHPEVGRPLIADTTTGPLGQGLATAVGMAIAERALAARYGDEISNHFTYVIAGDGCLMEGISHEAISLAGHLRLSKLIVFWDDNGITIDGAASLAVSDNQRQRFEACGWSTAAVDGHDPEAVAAAIAAAQTSDRPTLIACRTTIGKGAPTKAGSEKTHGAPLGAAEIAGLRAALDWPAEAFAVPEAVLAVWRAAGRRGLAARLAWEGRYAALAPDRRDALEGATAGRLPAGLAAAVSAFKRAVSEGKPKNATRKSSQDVLDALVPLIPELVGGSADLTHSNLTIAKGMKPIVAGDFSGNYLHYGIREFAMAAIMNGLALHGGFIPYGGTFMVFSDYMRNAIRLAALMDLRAIYVLTHDSIGVGEDGPTHQPVEHLAALRAMPNLLVFRPADGVETVESWALALAHSSGPSALALSRQNLPTLRTSHTEDNLTARGGYVLAEAAAGPRKVTLLATGSEVSLALTARAALEAEGVGTAVISMPCWALFDRQPEAYRDEVLGSHTVRIGVEAASPFGWERYVGLKGIVIGMPGFGLSAPADQVYAHFGITAEAVAAAARKRLAEIAARKSCHDGKPS